MGLWGAGENISGALLFQGGGGPSLMNTAESIMGKQQLIILVTWPWSSQKIDYEVCAILAPRFFPTAV